LSIDRTILCIDTSRSKFSSPRPMTWRADKYNVRYYSMADPYDLSKLSPEAFENIVNFLAMKTLGLGSTGFGPGADGGRDGYFEGEAPYPSESNRWSGVWYIQSKFHAPHLSKDPQRWLVGQVASEIKAYESDVTDRVWPDNWIIATNIDQSGKPEIGSFDKIKKMLSQSAKGKTINFHVWGGRKILDMLAVHGEVARYYGHFLTPGHVLSALYEDLAEKRGSFEEIIRYFVVTQFSDHMFTKLDQAGSSSDARPKVHELFIDLPFTGSGEGLGNLMLSELCAASAQCHRYSLRKQFPESWNGWNKRSKRARVTLIKGGPGQGKSTVGQYLCQIHRASLILADDAPRVVEATTAAAQAVCEAAQRDGFWPASSRIPIQIELKEFAHWSSQRTPAQTRTVLAYIAEAVSIKIASDVAPKAIKKLLSKRAWIAVFDGLDEVPNDFKDDVAKEVMYFLDDVLIEIDADVLALCTSRPQGYSGQFAGLDGSVANLSLLDARKAIECARPLLQYGRSSAEAETSIQTLEAAIQSPNVKELMTTPLQSHIMAVVVRDGGRPPERRWQLFNSFYLVMKKRESLKNFQDPRIAKLLREEDRLLRSVHMRLGVVLHARAERSEGAQATLSKEEFRILVKDVVAELVDQDIDGTVDVVMEATTERLVLVSTPENGAHVRFDIRQLQEFFAAEFLYAGVDSGELASRIDTIGGDAHWREVMHFLLSALIENQRTTDIAVAVQVLRRLNEGEESSPSKLYSRRMARAGLLASRLLMEGVLEQDQRDRQRIKPLFDPISGIFDLENLAGLARVRPTRSRKWLIEFLLDKIATSSAREYIGALYMLGWLLPDEHAGNAQATTAFMNVPTQFQGTLFGMWFPTEEAEFAQHRSKQRDGVIPSRWVTEIAVTVLNSPRWLDYPADVISILIRGCRQDNENFIAASKQHGLNAETSEIIFKCMNFGRDHNPRQAATAIDCGLIEANAFVANWSNGKKPSSIPRIDIEALDQTHGAFRLMLSCVAFSYEQNPKFLKEFVSIADGADVKRLGAIPHGLLALVPIPDQYSLRPYTTEHLHDIFSSSKFTVETFKETIRIPIQRLMLKDDKEVTNDAWTRLATELPKVAVDLAFNVDLFHVPGRRQASGVPFVPELIAVFDRMPDEVLAHILRWGYLQQHAPELLERVKKKASTLPVKIIDFRVVPHAPVLPFTVQLPQDAYLLEGLAAALINWSEASLQFAYRVVRKSHEDEDFSTLVSSYGLSLEHLRNVAESNSFDSNARAGAIALYWTLVGSPSSDSRSQIVLDLSKEKVLYEALVNESNEKWLTLALVKGALLSSTEANPDALSIVTSLIERCLDGNGPRDELAGLIKNWRERSTAPVHSRQVLETWLGYKLDTSSQI
jgi:hypothetical protein